MPGLPDEKYNKNCGKQPDCKERADHQDNQYRSIKKTRACFDRSLNDLFILHAHENYSLSVELQLPHSVQWMNRLWTCPSSACISTAPQLPQQ